MYSALYFYLILTEIGFSRQIFIEALNIKFHRNPSSGSRSEAWGRAHIDRRTDLKIIALSTDCANATKKLPVYWIKHHSM